MRRPLPELVDLLQKDGIKLEGEGSRLTCRCFCADRENQPRSMRVDATHGRLHCQACGLRGNAYTYLSEFQGKKESACFELLEREYGWSLDKCIAQRDRHIDDLVEQAEKYKSAPARWVESIFTTVNYQKRAKVHDYCRADGSLAYRVARYEVPTGAPPGKKTGQLVPFTPARSRRDGYWVKCPIGPQAQGIPPDDRPFAEGERYPVYGLPKLLAADPAWKVFVLTDERCADAVSALTWPDDDGKQVSPLAGISVRHDYRAGDPHNSFPMLDLEPLAERPCMVVANPDPASHKVAEAIARTLHVHYRCKIDILLPTRPTHGTLATDIGDAALRGIKEFHRWMKASGDFKPYEPAPNALTDIRLPPLARSEHFTVLGLAGDKLVVRRKPGQELLLLRRTALTDEEVLQQIAPLAWWLDQCGKVAFGLTMRYAFSDALLRAGEAGGIIDLAFGSAGRGAHHDDGVIRYNLGDKVLEADADNLLTKEVALDAVDFLYHAGPPIALVDDPDAERWARDFYDVISEYRWQNADMHRAVMGWCVTSLIGGCLPARPHLWIEAPGRAVRTFIGETLIGRVFGPTAQTISASPANALDGATVADSLPTTIDGFGAATRERSPNQWDRAFRLLEDAARTPGADGARLPVNQTAGPASTVRARFSALVMDDQPRPRDRGEDVFVMARTTCVPVPAQAHVERVIIDATEAHKMLAVRSRIIRHAAVIREKAHGIYDQILREDPETPMHEGAILAALTAGAWFLSGEEQTISRDTVFAKHDRWAPLMTVMAQKVRRDGREDLTIAELLYRAYFTKSHFEDPDPGNRHSPSAAREPAACKALARQHGFMFRNDDELWVAPEAPKLRELLLRSSAPDFDWLDYLSTLPGSFRPRDPKGRYGRRRFDRKLCDVVTLGGETLKAIGFGR